MFRWIVFGSVLLLFVVSFLGLGLYYYSKKYRKVLYRVELLEGSKGSNKIINDEGFEVEKI